MWQILFDYQRFVGISQISENHVMRQICWVNKHYWKRSHVIPSSVPAQLFCDSGSSLNLSATSLVSSILPMRRGLINLFLFRYVQVLQVYHRASALSVTGSLIISPVRRRCTQLRSILTN